MSRRVKVAWLSLVFLCTSALYAQEVTARASVDSTNYLIGDWITVHVEVRHPSGAALTPLVGDTLTAFQVIDRGVLEKTTETQTSTRVVVAGYDSALSVIPPIPFLYTIPGDTTLHRVATNSIGITIHKVPVDTSKEFKDLKPPLTISITLAEIALYVGIFLVLAAAGFFAYRYWKKRSQRRAPEPVYVSPPRPAHVIALEQLAELKEKKLWQQGRIKEYYSEGTEIVRRYFENRYGIMALEQTTGEIMSELKKHRHAEKVWQETETVLRRADLVKFAKLQPGIDEHEETLTVAFDIVEKTRGAETPSATQPQHAGEAHVGV